MNWYAKRTNAGSNHEQGLVIADDGANVAATYNPEHAELIAAAPELLGALESLLKRAESLDQSATHEGLQNAAALAQARAAIQKAKG